MHYLLIFFAISYGFKVVASLGQVILIFSTGHVPATRFYMTPYMYPIFEIMLATVTFAITYQIFRRLCKRYNQTQYPTLIDTVGRYTTNLSVIYSTLVATAWTISIFRVYDGSTVSLVCFAVAGGLAAIAMVYAFLSNSHLIEKTKISLLIYSAPIAVFAHFFAMLYVYYTEFPLWKVLLYGMAVDLYR